MKRLVAVMAALPILISAGCAPGTAPTAARSPGLESTPTVTTVPDTPNPLQHAEFYFNPDSPALTQLRAWRAENNTTDADTIHTLAVQPTAIWFTGPDNPHQAAQKISTQAAAAGRWPVFTLYNIPGRDCGQYSSGGARGRDDYLAWIGSFASGIANRRAVVIVEPDAIAHAMSGCDVGGTVDDRYRMLAAAVDIVKKQPGVVAYLDAGNAGWVQDTDQLANALRLSGIKHADGFSLNVANFQTTQATITYGQQLSRSLGGQHFVIDTSRNGAGPSPSTEPEAWCNPAGRKLGHLPTTHTNIPDVDAFIWIKQPGNSDGACRGGPPAGQWSARLALDLAS